MKNDDKGKFATTIGDDVIAEALKSVERRTGKTEALKPSPPVDVAGNVALEPEGPTQSEPSPLPQAAPSNAEVTELKAELELSMAKGRELMGRIKDEHEKMLRAAADLENFKKRAAKEKEEVQKYGSEKLLKELLPVVDNFDRALEHAKSPADYESLKKGVEMIRKLFEDTLGKHGVKSFSAKGKPFDPTVHEAMSAAETTEVPPNFVLNEVVRGFTLNDRLVRPALVVVARAPAVAAPAESASAPTTPSTPEKT